ncbi:hypothetical protein [Acinetobacter faecalis]|uniref:hypothetical protein n=1 Tax=Acinetobacter faecalis TaxID=2665161 RepID=UPI002A913E46|nr:hypothetical protein [Acinetobacter faecalis]MDY6450528.1 hypothetical protein [Acinetobacter faecalis]
MKLSVKSKTILMYSLSPFFTGFIVFFIYKILDLNSIDDMTSLIYVPIAFGVMGLVTFCIPAAVVGLILDEYREFNIYFRLVLSIIVGFPIPFIMFIFVRGVCDTDLSSFSKFIDCFHIPIKLGVLGSITSLFLMLKLIIFPFKD